MRWIRPNLLSNSSETVVLSKNLIVSGNLIDYLSKKLFYNTILELTNLLSSVSKMFNEGFVK